METFVLFRLLAPLSSQSSEHSHFVPFVARGCGWGSTQYGWHTVLSTQYGWHNSLHEFGWSICSTAGFHTIPRYLLQINRPAKRRAKNTTRVQDLRRLRRREGERGRRRQRRAGEARRTQRSGRRGRQERGRRWRGEMRQEEEGKRADS